MISALDAALKRISHIIPQIIKPELVVRPVSDVGGIGFLARARPQIILDHVERAQAVAYHIGLRIRFFIIRVINERLLVVNASRAQAQGVIDLAHPDRVTPGQIIVHRYQMTALALQGVQVNRKGGGKGFSFTGFHFGDHSLMQNDPSHQLYVKMPLFQISFSGFTD